ncbi:hypothetical protein O181_006958 [Austropuccinia psidii MF-1]|uniref:Reverse transcriptase Ty1/copia-type domain-containing protein n=1 Tax=Austropuccinia psidii MF-1 TaxID=1389203 RepID=A0A9Q3GH36_9BASI|nr:hypothetical protein [Austropuccinia psidii MF-1]
MDVRCAFLNGKPKEELYIFYPDGLPTSNNFKTLRLNKSLYGLKQSPRCWHLELRKTLIKLNLIPSKIDPCPFFCKDKLKPFYLYVHVDDLLFGGSWVADFKTQLNLYFDMEDLHVKSPKDRHYQAVIHVHKYLNFTKNLELRLGCKELFHSPEEIICFTDSDWGGAKENRSFSGSIIYYHGSLGWRSQKQRVVALSSAEAKYNALSSCCQDSEWICQLLFEITNKRITSIIYSDNQSSIALASNRIYHHGTRHIDFRLIQVFQERHSSLPFKVDFLNYLEED